MEGFPGVHFQPDLGTHTNKKQDLPDYLHQLALEIINRIPATDILIYTDGSKDDRGSCGSGIFIKAPDFSRKLTIKNPDFCSVFRSELIAIEEALNAIGSITSSANIWILSDSRSAIQHLSNWNKAGDKTSVSILNKIKQLSNRRKIFIQWIPSHIGLFGNENADLLAKQGASDSTISTRPLTFPEICSRIRTTNRQLWNIPPAHS